MSPTSPSNQRRLRGVGDRRSGTIVKEYQSFLLLILVLVIGIGLRLPASDVKFSGYDLPRFVGQAFRVFLTSPFVLAPPLKNTIYQLLITSGGFEFSILSLGIGLFSLLGIPLTEYNLFSVWALLGSVNILLFYVMGRLVRSNWTGLIAASIYSVLPASVLCSRLLYPNNSSLAFFMMALIGLTLYYRSGRRAWLAACTLSLVLMLVGDRLFITNLALFVLLWMMLLRDKARSSGSSLRATFSTCLRSLDAWIIIVPASVIVGLHLFIFFWGAHRGYDYGVIMHSLRKVPEYKNPSLALLSPHGSIPLAGGGFGSFLSRLIIENGIFFPLLGACALIWTCIKFKSRTLLERFFLVWFFLYFLLDSLFQRRADPYILAFISPLIFFSASFLTDWGARSSFRRKAVASLVVLGVGATTMWSIEVVHDARISRIPGLIMNYRQGGSFSYRIYRDLINDYGLKAAGSWVREFTAPDDKILLLGGRWTPYTAEYYFGKQYANYPNRAKRLYHPHFDLDCDIERLAWNISKPRCNPQTWPKDMRYVVIVHHPAAEEDFWKREGNMIIRDNVQNLRRLVKEDLKFHKNVEIVDSGKTYIEIYSRTVRPLVRLNKAEAEGAFDRKFANLESLAFSPYMGMWLWVK